MGLEKLERGTLEKIAESSPELQELYLKKFQEIEDKINKKEADWGDFESLLYEAITLRGRSRNSNEVFKTKNGKKS